MARRGAFAVAACAAALAACAVQAPSGAPAARERLEAHVRFLASDALAGRMTGTESYRVAAEYVASQFRLLGLQPAGEDGYFQEVPYASAFIEPERSSLRVIGAAGTRTLKWKREWVAGGDVLAEDLRVSAPVVFAGHGIAAPELGHDDYAGLDVRGKWVLVMGGAPRSFSAAARAYYSTGRVSNAAAVRHGAVGVLALRDAYSVKQYDWDVLNRNAGTLPAMRWKTPDGRAADTFPQLKGSATIADRAADTLLAGSGHSYAQLLEISARGEALPRFPLKVRVEQTRRSRVSLTQGPNVIGVLPGSDPALAAEHVVYTAHLDHIGVGAPVQGDAIYNGMYDNAMGIALMLETARVLAAKPPKRSILFVAVGGEERGLLGSDYFAQHPTRPRASLAANLNLDMPLFLFPAADVVAFGAEHSSLGAMAQAAAEAEGLRLGPDPLPDEVIFIRSDQYSLVRQGVPALFLVPGFASSDPAIDGGRAFHGFLGTHYHKPSDDLRLPVDWDSAERFLRINARLGADIADAPARPRWNTGDFFGDRFTAGS